MAAFNFPPSPSNGDTYTLNSVTYQWDGAKWVRYSAAVGAQGAQGVQGHQGHQGNTGNTGAQGGLSTYSVPSGGIIIWSGAANAIPSGWVLCDGTNSTPDLRQRFVMGSGDNPSVARTGQSVGAQGGYTDTIVVQHNHTITDNGHTHNLLYNHGAFGGTSGAVTPRSGNTPVTPGITGRISTVGNHTHTGTTNAGTASGTTGGSTPDTNSQGSSATNANLPPYYALCYIMKS